ncbi:hypothetical protein [Psychrobacter sp. DAB_AL32B]|uniref:hypothetical protein n=1 Tax=Psychrobacter sp. DAB_AL32B TaxID=1028414 RepID=UPI000B7F0980|nr:hypothetical protein [Psychrobacter sp. DAB_AL32B]OXL24651.1 hypothetical protein CAN34_05270 [Psychrobacter sp. DAB_AL32B]
MKVLRGFLACLAVTAVSLNSTNAKINNGNDFFNNQQVEVFDQPLGDGVRSTTWYAKPLRVQLPENNALKPEVMWLQVYSDGYTGIFNQYVEINCKEPVKSHIMTADGDKISLKKSMAYPNNPRDKNFTDRIDRDAVGGIFSYYCS